MKAGDLPPPCPLTLLPVMTSAFDDLLRETIASAPDRCLPWAQVMDLALYHPEHGYYAGKPRRVGSGGDFYTAVSVGPLYGRLLAAVAAEVWQFLGAPGDFTLIEQGAHEWPTGRGPLAWLAA